MHPVLDNVPRELTFSIVLLVVFFIMLFVYGFHGLLKFGRSVNYLMAVILAVLAVLLCVSLVISAFEYIADDHMSAQQKETARRGMLMTAVGAVVLGLIAFLRYNYAQLYAALNVTLPNRSRRRRRGRK